MLILTATTDKFDLVTSAAADIDVHASWMDHTLSGDNFEAGRTNTAITTATTTDIVPSPGAGVTRNAKTINIRNKDTADSTDVTVRFNQGGTAYELHKVTLAPGEALTYVEGIGWFHYKTTAKMDKLLVVTGDVVNATTAFADVTGLTVPIKSGKTYCFEAALIYQTNATTTGARFAVNGPASPTYLRLAGIGTVTVSATAGVVSTQTATVSAYDTSVIGAQTTGPGTVDSLARFDGTIVPSADGTFAVRCQSEVAVANGLIVRRGSWLRIREPDNV